jgi:hypothetical protein
MANIVMLTDWIGGSASPASHAAQPVAEKLSNLSPEQLALLMRRLHQKKKQGAAP